MESIFARLYRRLGVAYLALPVLFGFLTAELNIVLVVAVGCLGVMGLPLDTTREIMGGALVAGTAAFGLAASSLLAIIPLVRWAAGRHDPELAPRAWINGTVTVKRIVWLFVMVVTIAVMPSGRAAAREAHLAAFATALVLLVPILVNATVGLLNVAFVEMCLFPVVREISAYLDTGFEPRTHPSSLMQKLLPTVILFTFDSAFFAIGLVRGADSVQDRVLAAMGAAAAVCLLALAFGYMVARSITLPMVALIEATRAVRNGILDVRVPRVSNDEAGELTQDFNVMVEGLRERVALHSALGTYVDPVVADRMLREGALLEGESRDVTVMFVDIVGFVSRSEEMKPEDVVDELNSFFEVVVPQITANGGHTNKLLGDGLMAVFGAPVAHEDHAERAVLAACAIRDRVVDRFAGKLKIGIGINSGTAIVGTTGGGGKLDFTVYGDVVNLASRVEAVTRSTGDIVLITDATRRLLHAPIDLEDRGEVTIRGRASASHLYAVRTPAFFEPSRRQPSE